VTAVNDKLTAHPELVNTDPYGEGWIVKLELFGEPPSDLLDETAYKNIAEASDN
jgi:glycine cleavage system H protein